MHSSVILVVLAVVGLAVATPSNRTFEVKDEPNYKDYAKVARYLVHKSGKHRAGSTIHDDENSHYIQYLDYTSLGTISILDGIKGYPMVSIMSVADSTRDGQSTGNIYLYLLHIDYITHDLKAENKLTALFSNNQDLACSKRGLDPMEPTCARVMITGYIAQVR